MIAKENLNKVLENLQFIKENESYTKVSIAPVNSVVITCTATIGKVGVTKIELTTNQQINALNRISSE